MKRILSAVLLLTIFLCGCSLNDNNTASDSAKIVVNLPKDNSVNGYRIDKIETFKNTSMPDIIYADDTIVADDYISDESSVTKDFCGNKNSKVFHNSSCGSVSKMKEENKVYFNNRDEFINNGYKPCGSCKP